MNLLIKNIDYVKVDFNNLEFFYKWLKTKLGDINWKFRYHLLNVPDKQKIIDKDYFYKPKEEIDYIMLLLYNRHDYYLNNGDMLVLSPNVRNPFIVIKGEIIKKDVSLE